MRALGGGGGDGGGIVAEAAVKIIMIIVNRNAHIHQKLDELSLPRRHTITTSTISE